MKTRHSLLCGIAILAIVTPATAQSDSTTPETMQASPQSSDTAQSDAPVAHHARHHRMGVSGPQYSTPAEKAATDRLNEQQLQQAQQEAAASPSQTIGPATPGAQPTVMQPATQPTDTQPATPATPPTDAQPTNPPMDAQPSTGSAPQNNGAPQQ